MSATRCLVCGSPVRSPSEPAAAGAESVAALRRLPSGAVESGRVCTECQPEADALENVALGDATTPPFPGAEGFDGGERR